MAELPSTHTMVLKIFVSELTDSSEIVFGSEIKQ